LNPINQLFFSFSPAIAHMTEVEQRMRDMLRGKRFSRVHDQWILTDDIDDPGVDQVFPMYPDQPFFWMHGSGQNVKERRSKRSA
jgi:hypothetical protein